jgi:hypothetical protein
MKGAADGAPKGAKGTPSVGTSGVDNTGTPRGVVRDGVKPKATGAVKAGTAPAPAGATSLGTVTVAGFKAA